METPSSTTPIRLVLVDDHFIVRMGVAAALGLHGDLLIVAQGSTGAQAIALHREHQPDLILLDWALPDLSGVEAAVAIRRESPDARIAILSAFESEEHIYLAVQAGVNAYLPKASEPEEIVRAIRLVYEGEAFFPPSISAKLAARCRRVGLSPRELQVLGELGQGKSNKEIAVALDISERAVKLHIVHILAKMPAKDRTHAVTLAIERGILRVAG